MGDRWRPPLASFGATIPETEKFVKELMGMQVKVSAAGHDSYGSWRDGEHDDLVLAGENFCAVEFAWDGEVAGDVRGEDLSRNARRRIGRS